MPNQQYAKTHHHAVPDKSLDSLISKVRDVIPLRFHIEVSRASASSRKTEFALIEQTFKKHVPPIAIGEHIGSGGFADVFLAQSYYGGSINFAIKILRRDLLKPRRSSEAVACQEEMRIKDVKKRYTNESYVQWHLSQSLSPEVAQSVVQVYDHGEFDRKTGYRFILMEQMGFTVRQFIVEVDHAKTDDSIMRYKTDLMINIATIISNVHKEGVFHRDIKPENILFIHRNKGEPSRTFAGSDKAWPVMPIVKLGDFGTVRWVKSYSDKYDAIIIGSQCYMSPEQILEPRYLDSRTDIYSFGVVCYEILFGIHPKKIRTGTRHVLEKIAFSKPEKSTPPEGFKGLNEIIFRCMEDLEARYQNMGDVVEDLLKFRSDKNAGR